MNAGKDYSKAKAQAQANANRFQEPYVLILYNGIWWANRLSTYTTEPPQGSEVIKPQAAPA